MDSSGRKKPPNGYGRNSGKTKEKGVKDENQMEGAPPMKDTSHEGETGPRKEFYVHIENPKVGMILSAKLKVTSQDFFISYQGEKKMSKWTEVPLHLHMSGDSEKPWAYATTYVDGNVPGGVSAEFPDVPTSTFHPGQEFHVLMRFQESAITVELPDLGFFKRFYLDEVSRVAYRPYYKVIHFNGSELVHGILLTPLEPRGWIEMIATELGGEDGRDAIFYQWPRHSSGRLIAQFECNRCNDKFHLWKQNIFCKPLDDVWNLDIFPEPRAKKRRLSLASPDGSHTHRSSSPSSDVVLAADDHDGPITTARASSKTTIKSHVSVSLHGSEDHPRREQSGGREVETPKSTGEAAGLSLPALQAAGLLSIDQKAKADSLVRYLEQQVNMVLGELADLHLPIATKAEDRFSDLRVALDGQQKALEVYRTGIRDRPKGSSSTKLVKGNDAPFTGSNGGVTGVTVTEGSPPTQQSGSLGLYGEGKGLAAGPMASAASNKDAAQFLESMEVAFAAFREVFWEIDDIDRTLLPSDPLQSEEEESSESEAEESSDTDIIDMESDSEPLVQDKSEGRNDQDDVEISDGRTGCDNDEEKHGSSMDLCIEEARKSVEKTDHAFAKFKSSVDRFKLELEAHVKKQRLDSEKRTDPKPLACAAIPKPGCDGAATEQAQAPAEIHAAIPLAVRRSRSGSRRYERRIKSYRCEKCGEIFDNEMQKRIHVASNHRFSRNLCPGCG